MWDSDLEFNFSFEVSKGDFAEGSLQSDSFGGDETLPRNSRNVPENWICLCFGCCWRCKTRAFPQKTHEDHIRARPKNAEINLNATSFWSVYCCSRRPHYRRRNHHRHRSNHPKHHQLQISAATGFNNRPLTRRICRDLFLVRNIPALAVILLHDNVATSRVTHRQSSDMLVGFNLISAKVDINSVVRESPSRRS